MDNSIQIAFRIDRASRDLARCFNINISEVCRKAIQAEIGLQLEQNPNMLVSTKDALDKYTEFLERQKEQQSKLLENITIVTNNIKQEKEKEQKKQEKQLLLMDYIIKLSGQNDKKRAAWYCLPEYHVNDFSKIDKIREYADKNGIETNNYQIIEMLRKWLQ